MISLLDTLAPPLSLRRQFLTLACQAPITLFQMGPLIALQRTLAAFNHYRRTGTLLNSSIQSRIKNYSYANWIEDHEPDKKSRAIAWRTQAEAVHTLAWPLRFSIVLAVADEPVAHLKATIQSVCAQSYPDWELWLVNSSRQRTIGQYLDQMAVAEPRIHVTHLDAALTQATIWNAGLDLAQGDFCLLLSPDALLAPELLYEVAVAVNEQPAADLVYFDQDCTDRANKTRFSPWFKPDWSPDLMWSTNLLQHAVLSRRLLTQIGRFDPALGEAYAWDWALRATLHALKVVHIAKILYHQRQLSAQKRAPLTNALTDAAIDRCLQAHLARLDLPDARIEFPSPGHPRVFLPTQASKVSIIILVPTDTQWLQACVASIFTVTAYLDYEIILVAPHDAVATAPVYPPSLTSDPRVRIIPAAPVRHPDEMHTNFNRWQANNWGAKHATGTLLLFLDSAVEVQDPQWLAEMIGWALRPEIGVVGARLVCPDGTIQHNPVVIGLHGLSGSLFAGGSRAEDGIFGSTEWIRNCSAVTGDCLLVRRPLFEQLSGFDEIYQAAYSDVEFCGRVRSAGYRIVSTPFPQLVQHAVARIGNEPLSDVVRAACHLLLPMRQGDPYFNAGLSYRDCVPRLVTPWEEPAAARVLTRLQARELITDEASPVFIEHLYRYPPLPSIWPQVRPSTATGRKILLISHDLSLSGAPLMLYALAEHLMGAGFQVAVFSAEDGAVHPLYAELKIPVIVQPSIYHHPSNALAIAQVAHEYDLIIANTIVSWRAIPVAKALGLPIIAWVHEAQLGVDLFKNVAGLARSLAHADCIIFPTQTTANLYREHVRTTQTQVIPYGLDPQSLEQAATNDLSADRLERKRLRIMCIGSLEPRKGQDFLLRSVAALPAHLQEQIEVFLVGRAFTPEYVTLVEGLARQLPYVNIVGQTPRQQTMAYLRSADILILPSRDEVLPVILLEAMYHAKAIIATRVGGVAEAITSGVHGLLIEIDDQPALTAALQHLITNDGLRQQLGDQAQQQFYQGFTIDKMGQRFVEIIHSLLVR